MSFRDKYREIKENLCSLYVDDNRPWLIGFSGGKDSTMVTSLIVDGIISLPHEQRTKPVAILCTDTLVEMPAVVEKIESTLDIIDRFSQAEKLNIEVQLLRPLFEQSFWVNIIGRGYPPPNRVFRWCTQRMKIDPVNEFVKERLGHWGEAILHLGARRQESNTRAQTLSRRTRRKGLTRHTNLPKVWVSNPIEFLTTDEVWDYLLEKPNPWGTTNHLLYKLYDDAGGGECAVHIDTSTPSCGNSRFGCWTCTVVERDKSGEGLLKTGDKRMAGLLKFRELLLEVQNPENGWRDDRRKNGDKGPGPITMRGRRHLLTELLKLEQNMGLSLIDSEELRLIQQFWKSARNPDDGIGVGRIINKIRGGNMEHNTRDQLSRLQEMQDSICESMDLSSKTISRLLSVVEQHSEKHRAHGLPAQLIDILNDEVFTENK